MVLPQPTGDARVKGVVLAGGLGTRLHPMTKVMNKHLLDVFDEPMIYYPIRTLARAGIQELVLVTGDEIEQFRSLLGDGRELGVHIMYERQEGELGIADALARAAPHIDEDDRMVVILGDNVYQEDLSSHIDSFAKQDRGAKLLLYRVSIVEARRFGVATVEGDRILRIEEKPHAPKSDLVVTGCYMYDSRVFEIIRGLTPSTRGELEITDVNNTYIEWSNMTFDVLKGWWTDAGTPASKLKASILVALAKGVTFHA
jgi:glucose-1-phosphate thymidylyltransferase